MKIFLLIGSIIILSLHSSFAQKKWFISPVLGVNMTPLKESSDDPGFLKAGLSIGALTGTAINEHWRLNFGLTFNQRHTNNSFEEPSQSESLLTDLIGNLIGDFDFGGTDIVDVNTSYWTVDLPVTIDYVFNSGFFIHGGLFVNTVIKANNEVKTTTHIPVLELIDLDDLGLGVVSALLPQNGTENTSNTLSEGLRSTNFGLSGGFGADVGNIQLKFQYQYGFGSIRTDNHEIGVSNQQAFSFHIAYLFFPTAEPKSTRLKPRYDLELIK